MSNIWNNRLPRIITPFLCRKRNNRPPLLFEEIRYRYFLNNFACCTNPVGMVIKNGPWQSKKHRCFNDYKDLCKNMEALCVSEEGLETLRDVRYRTRTALNVAESRRTGHRETGHGICLWTSRTLTSLVGIQFVTRATFRDHPEVMQDWGVWSVLDLMKYRIDCKFKAVFISFWLFCRSAIMSPNKTKW